MKVVLRSLLTALGAQCVRITLAMRMQLLSVDSWGLKHQVMSGKLVDTIIELIILAHV